jgi:beta-carotene hydroxylase
MTVAPSHGMSSMRPRFAADYRTLLWVIMAGALLAFVYWKPEYAPYLFVLNCYFALACGVIAHNHNHCPTFADKRANQLFANVISVFYGYPTFAWIPTHNLNHHKYVNRAGDATITWRFTNKHTLPVAASYFFVSSWYQQYPIRDFVNKARAQNPGLYRRIQVQRAFFVGAHVSLLALAIALHGLGAGLLLYVLACAVPAFFALWTIMLFNYEQHVHADPWSAHNHSRSWEGRVVNFLLFNNGLHAAHHENPGTHWSKLRAVHEEIRPSIDPRLVEGSMWWYFAKQYLLAPLFPRFGSVQVGRAPFDPPEGKLDVVTSAEVELGDAGSNAAMAR